MTARVIALTSLKGGVGKTSAAVNLAAAAGQRGFRVLLWDLDPQASATWALGIDDPEGGGALGHFERRKPRLLDALTRTSVPGVSLAPSDLSLRHVEQALMVQRHPTRKVSKLLRRLPAAFDVHIIDAPPGISLVFDNLAEAADLLLIPVEPTPLTMRTVTQLAEHAGREYPSAELAFFLSRIDDRRPAHRRARAATEADTRYLTTEIPESSAVERLGEERRPTVLTAPRSLAASRFQDLWSELEARLELP